MGTCLARGAVTTVAWFHSFQLHLPAVNPLAPTATCFILLTLYSDLPHPLLRDPGIQQSLPSSTLSSSRAELPTVMCSLTPTFPLLVLTGEQGGQAVSARWGLGLLQRGQESGKSEGWEFIRDEGPESGFQGGSVQGPLGVPECLGEHLGGFCGSSSRLRVL